MHKTVAVILFAIFLSCSYQKTEITLGRGDSATVNEYKFEVTDQGEAKINGKTVGKVKDGEQGVFSITNGKLAYRTVKKQGDMNREVPEQKPSREPSNE